MFGTLESERKFAGKPTLCDDYRKYSMEPIEKISDLKVGGSPRMISGAMKLGVPMMVCFYGVLSISERWLASPKSMIFTFSIYSLFLRIMTMMFSGFKSLCIISSECR